MNSRETVFSKKTEDNDNNKSKGWKSWIEKIEENIARDQRNDKQLQQLGWTPVHFWEKDVLKQLQDCVDQIDELTLAQLIDQTVNLETHELSEL